MASSELRLPNQRAEPPRTQLTSPWTLLGLAIAVGVTLVLIFPGTDVRVLPAAGNYQSAADPLAEFVAFVTKEPNNPKHRFTLAKKQAALGSLANARATLEPLYNSPDPAVRQSARLADFELQILQMQAMQPGSPEREREVERLRQELVAMTQYEWNTPGLLELADRANQLGARKLRAELLLRVARSDQTVTRDWIDEAARSAVSDSEYVTGAEIHFTALARASSLDDRRHHFMFGVRAYQAGNMLREGMSAAERNIGTLSGDDQTLRFMVRLARAANDLKRAESYVRRLMRMSQHNVIMRWMQAAAGWVVPSAQAAEREATPGVPAGMRAYDAANYDLAYEVFLSAKNLQDAHRVARAAVQQVPNDMKWRQRLAQVNEWSGRPGEALEHWLFVARRTGSGEAWQSVLRIAPGLMNDEAVVEAMRYQATRGALTDAQVGAIAAAYERLGRPREGVEYLTQEYAKRPRPALLEQIARLHEASGNIEAAIAAHRALIDTVGATTPRVTTLASLLISRGRFGEAYEVLERHRDKAPAADADYLRLMGDLALRLRDDTAAQSAYERIVVHPSATLDDYTRLVSLLQARQPEAAARLAEAAHRRFNSPHLLLTALGLHSQRRDFPTMRRIFAEMSPQTEQALAGNAGFLVIRADYRAATGSPQLALADFREALRIDPANRFARMGMMFHLIAHGMLLELRREMPLATEIAQRDPEFQGAVGAAWLALDDPSRALPYFAGVVKRNPDDYLWLLNYADALERNLQSDMAWRVRRHAWIKIREATVKKERSPRELLQAHARVAVQFLPGDAGFAVIRNLLRLDAEADAISSDPLRQAIDAGTRELVLAWMVSTEQHLGAKAWLWTQYGRSLAAPKWAEVSLALVHGELDTVQRALERYPDAIPRYDRHEAARRTQQYRHAQSIAFAGLEKYPYDDEMHLRLTHSAFDMVSHTQAGYTSFRRGTVGGHEWNAETAVWLSPRLRLSFDVSYIHQGLINTVALASIPSTDRLYGLTALWRHSVGETRFTVFHREALASTTGFTLAHQYPFSNRLSGRLGFGYNERTLETSGLAAGGVRDQIFVDAHYTPSKREFVIGQLFSRQYYSQEERTKIGSSYGLNWEVGHRFRTEYPDFHVRAAGSVSHFDREGSGDAATIVLNPAGTVPRGSFFLPGSFAVYGLYTGFGTYYQNNYTRALRPFVDIGVNRNTVTGTGYGALVGVSGSVIGADRMTLYASYGRGGTGTNESSRAVGLRYMYLFDNF